MTCRILGAVCASVGGSASIDDMCGLCVAQSKTPRELASRAAELIAGRREGTLTPGESRGSTFTVSNFGALGVDNDVPLIKHSEAAILGMGAIKPRPVASALKRPNSSASSGI
jgi:2-oxoisovalerate dehydrogenase E2 component (dihydrolipoyl transacylase)